MVNVAAELLVCIMLVLSPPPAVPTPLTAPVTLVPLIESKVSSENPDENCIEAHIIHVPAERLILPTFVVVDAGIVVVGLETDTTVPKSLKFVLYKLIYLL